MNLIEPFRIPLWRETRVPFERSALLRSPVWRGEDVLLGDEAPVMLIPGFLAGDTSLGHMARWLRRIGYRPCRAGILANVDCTAKTVTRIGERLDAKAEAHGRPVWLIGHSRGGTMARILAVQRPDLVAGVICLGSPLGDQFAIHPLVGAQVRLTALLGSAGLPGLFTRGCRDKCCTEARAALAAPFPSDIPFTCIYSRSDGVVSWRQCLDPVAQNVEVLASHCGMAFNRAVFAAVAAALAGEDAGLVAAERGAATVSLAA